MAQSTTQIINYSYLPQLIGHLTGLTHLRAIQLCTDELEDVDLTPKQFVALEFIAKNPDISQKQIASHIGTTPTVLVNILDVLTERGLVERIKSRIDRRRHSVALTQAGKAMLPQIKTAAFAVETRFKTRKQS